MGFGLLGLSALESLSRNMAEASSPAGAPGIRLPHFQGRAKRVIHLFANGGPSHVDTFDPKPLLTKLHGQPLNSGHLKTERPTGAAFRSPFAFAKHGKCGTEVSELFSERGEMH
jgi:hypothetical protein